MSPQIPINPTTILIVHGRSLAPPFLGLAVAELVAELVAGCVVDSVDVCVVACVEVSCDTELTPVLSLPKPIPIGTDTEASELVIITAVCVCEILRDAATTLADGIGALRLENVMMFEDCTLNFALAIPILLLARS